MSIKKIVEKIHLYDLDFDERFEDVSFSELEFCYNGCGPNWLPENIRKWLSDYFRLFVPAFVIHDFEYEHADKTERGFKESNKRLGKNCRKIVKANFSWWRQPFTFLKWYARSYYLTEACDRFGWSAWLDD